MNKTRTSGRWTVVALAVLCGLAAMGTCARYRSDNPTTREVHVLGPTLVTGRLHRTDGIREGMPARVTVAGGPVRFTGEVSAVRGSEVEVALDTPITASSGALLILSVDASDAGADRSPAPRPTP